MISDLISKHKSKIFITLMLMVLICTLGASFASEEADNLQIDEDSIDLDSQIDDEISVDESLQDEGGSQGDCGGDLQASTEKLGGTDESSLGLKDGQGTFSELASMISSSTNRSVELDKDYVRNGYSGKDNGNTVAYIVLDKAITIDGKGHFLDSEGGGTIFRLHTHEKIILKNLIFTNTPSVAISGIYLHDGQVYFQNCTFVNVGGGISVTGNYGYANVLVKYFFTDVKFINCTNEAQYLLNFGTKAETIMKNVTFMNTRSLTSSKGDTDYSGAIRSLTSFKGNLTDIKFINNTGKYGGAMHFEGLCELNLTNAEFIENSASLGGGAIYTKTDIIGTFDNVRFISNNAPSGQGGAIYSTVALSTRFNHVEFINNTAQSYGGAISANSLYSSFDNAIFKGNTAISSGTAYGGAIYSSSSFNSTFNNVTFTDNYVKGYSSAYGGAIYASSVIEPSFKDVNFENNNVFLTRSSSVSSYGGAVYMGGGKAVFDNVNFTKNSASTAGALYYSNPTSLSLVDVNFKSNRANTTSTTKSYGGGAVYLSGNRAASPAEFKRVTFFNNSAVNYGGAILFATMKINLEDCTFIANHVQKEGGAIHARGSLNVLNTNFTANEAPIGSAISVSDYYQMTINIDGCNFTKNNGSVFETYYSYPYGGDLNISNSNFDLNYGTAVISTYNTNVTNCNITNNAGRAFYFRLYEEGVIYYYDLSRLNYLNGVTCINNTAAYGSAILNRGTNLTVSNSVFLKNKANSTSLKVDYDKFYHIIKVDYITGNNYINAIDSNNDVNFTNVTYFDYNGILNSNDVYPIKSYTPPHVGVVTEVYESETTLKDRFNITSDDNGVIQYYYRTPLIHHIVVSHIDDDYYTGVTDQYDYTWGDFDELQRLVIDSPDGSVLNLTRNFTYIIGVDSITDGVLINKTLTINGNGFTINALNQSRIFRLECGNITLFDIRMINASSLDGSFIYGADVNNIEIDKCVFDNLNVSSQNQVDCLGGGVYLSGNHSRISNSQFLNLMALYGGAVYLNGTDIAIYNSNFTSCRAELGGAVFADEGALDNVVNKSSFINCNATYFGGAVFWNGENGVIQDSTFKNNTVEKMTEIGMDTIDLNGGGAILWNANNGLITASNFTDNNAAVNRSSKFKDNLYGGAILVFGQNTNISLSTFTANYAQSGGAVAIMNQSCNAVHPRYIKNANDLVKMGGYSSNIINCTFKDNFAQYGGAVMLKSYKNSVIDSEFYDNTAYLGGALIFEGMNGVINNSLFDNNVAHLGGAVVSGYNGTFNEKYSEEYWDSYWGEWRYRVVLVPYARFTGDQNSIVNSRFTNNSADSAGAVLWMDKNGVISDNTLFKSNSASNSFVRYNNSFARCYGEEIPQDAYESIQTNPNSGVMGLVVGLYTKDYAGAVYWVGSDGLIRNVDFIENTAVNGGALLQEVSTVFVDSSRFDKNSAKYGGAIWANNNSRISSSNFSQNNADLGGAIYWYGSYSQIDNSYLVDNKASFGGAIYALGEFSTLSNSELRLNKAGYGSAVYLDTRGLTIDSTTLLENQANSTSLFVNLSTTKFALIADVIFEGGDNLMNAVYTLSSNYALNNVTYWRVEGIVNTDDLTPPITDLESGQNITIELFTYNTIVPITASNITDNSGYTRISVPLNSGRYVVMTSHKEDNYYTEINDTYVVEFEMLDAFASLTVEDILYKENATVIVSCYDGATGNVNIFVDGVNYTTKALSSNQASFNVGNLKGGTHEIVAYYSGDINFASAQLSKVFNVKPISSYITVSTDGGIYKGPVTVNVAAGPDEITGEVILTIENNYGDVISINDVKSFSRVVNNLTAGKHNVTVYYKGDNNYLSSSNSTIFEVAPIDLPASAYASPDKIPSNRNVTFYVDVPNDFEGKVRVTVDGISKVYDVTGSTILIFNKLFIGQKNATIDFFGDKNYNELSVNSSFEVIKPAGSASGFGTVNSDDMTRGYGSPYDYQAAFLDYEGHLLINIDVAFVVDGNQYRAVTNKDGIAQLTESKLDIGNYNITCINLLTGEESTRKLSIVKRISDNKDVKVDFDSGKYFTVKVYGDDGKLAPEGEFVSMSIGIHHYVCRIDANGIAKLKITFNPNTYKVITEYKGYKVTNKIVVKQTLKLAKKTLKAKKGKKLVLKATLKWSSGKGINGKVIKFKFKGKTYKAKTNSKGLAKVTVSKKVTKKLKKGKKYAYSATYLKNTLKGTVKVKK